MLERIDGMFAIAIADTRSGVVHLIRDRVGIKPLYRAQCGTTVLFASEAKAFLAHPSFRAEIDPTHVDELLAFRYLGRRGLAAQGARARQAGPSPHDHPGRCDGGALLEHSRLPRQASTVTRRGGRLPRLVARPERGIAAAERCARGVPVVRRRRLFAGGRAGPFASACRSERLLDRLQRAAVLGRAWILAAAAAARVASHRFLFDEAAFMDALDAATWHMDQPISQPNSLALWLLAQRSRAHATWL